VDKAVGNTPSTLRLMLPEIYLKDGNIELHAAKIKSVMEDYLSKGIFKELDDSYIYIERTLSQGGLRRGLLGLLDLEEYDYNPSSSSPIRATRVWYPTDCRRE
jgi:hypothetical protein